VNTRHVATTLLAGLLAASAWAPAQTAPAPPASPAPPKPPSRLLTRGSRTPFLGVHIQDVTPDRVSTLKLKDERGVEITLVDKDAPAGKAGLKPQDVVISYNGTAVESAEQMRRLIRETPVGRTVQLGILRNGQNLTVPVTLGSAPAPRVFAFSSGDVHVPEIPPMPEMAMEMGEIPEFEVLTRMSGPRTGMMVESLTPQLAQYFGAKSGEGVLVRSVDKGSAAEQAGVHAGDVVTKVNNETVSDAGDLRRLLRGKTGNVTITVLRDKREQTLTLKVPERPQGSEFYPDDLAVSMKDMRASLDRMRPELVHIQVEAQKKAMAEQRRAMQEWKKHEKEYRKQMEQAMQEMERELDQ
jgi:serine protease Do